MSSGTLRQTLQKQHTDAETAGYSLEVIQVKPFEIKQKLQTIRDKLETVKPDLFIIGNGIRGNLEYTIFFERLVNICREVSPGTKMGFNTAPGSDIGGMSEESGMSDPGRQHARVVSLSITHDLNILNHYLVVLVVRIVLINTSESHVDPLTPPSHHSVAKLWWHCLVPSPA